MIDLESNDPVLFNILNPEYQNFKTKRKKGRIIIWSSVGVGGVLFWKSFIAFLDQSVPREDTTADNYLVAGLVLGGAGIIIGNKIKPSKRRFIYDTTQQFNQHSQGDKVIFAIQPNLNLGNNSSLGLTCSLSF